MRPFASAGWRSPYGLAPLPAPGVAAATSNGTPAARPIDSSRNSRRFNGRTRAWLPRDGAPSALPPPRPHRRTSSPDERVECLAQVGDQVVGGLDADRTAHERRIDLERRAR